MINEKYHVCDNDDGIVHMLKNMSIHGKNMH